MEDVDEEGAADDDSWRLLRLVYAHLPPSERHRVEYARKRRAPPKACTTRNFYQVMRVSEILFSVPIFPADLADVDDPACFLLNEYGWGF